MNVIQITKLVGIIVVLGNLCLNTYEFLKIKKEDPQYYIKRKLLHVEVWISLIFYLLLTDNVIIAVAV